MTNNRTFGLKAEKLACDFIKNKNYIVKDVNFRCKIGEIDIIAEFSGYIIFIEVKCRSNNRYGYPVEAVTFYKQKTILKVATVYLMNKNLNNVDCRFDIIEVYYRHGKYSFNHIENAFGFN